MNKAFEKILKRLEKTKDISQDDSVAEVVSTRIWNKAIQRAKSVVQEVAEEFATDTNVGTNGWIPCSVRLPEENIEVDVTIKEIDGSTYTKTSWLQEGQWVVKKSPLEPKVIAWKERPEPYYPEGE